jgi:hypothetical protein
MQRLFTTRLQSLKPRDQSRRTIIDTRYVLERSQEQHEHYTHAEYLDPSSGHVQHESLHGERLSW